MKKLIIIPDKLSHQYKRYKKQGRLSFTYLHGQLEMDCGYDCYNIANPEDFGFSLEFGSIFIIPEESKCGIIKCQFKRKPCTLFMWMTRGHYHGLVVYNSDKESYEYAEKCYNNKESII